MGEQQQVTVQKENKVKNTPEKQNQMGSGHQEGNQKSKEILLRLFYHIV